MKTRGCRLKHKSLGEWKREMKEGKPAETVEQLLGREKFVADASRLLEGLRPRRAWLN